MSLKGKHILLGVTGSIAAYKAAILIRALVKVGAEVKVVMTPMSKKFITPLTLSTLSGNPILVDFFNPENGEWNSHVKLGIWADLYLIAPASANTISKMVAGIADNLLLTTYLSARCPVVIAPAMDLDMYASQIIQENLNILEKRGVKIIEPESGELASGLIGKGRMEEPSKILNHVISILNKNGSLKGKKILLTGGPTRESIDPVRFISNYSSGKMAMSIAKSLSDRGAIVEMVLGPVNIDTDYPRVHITNITSASQMSEAAKNIYKSGVDVAILCAAVSDFKPSIKAEEKIKNHNKLSLDLVPNEDISASLGRIKKDGVIHVGFALETNNELSNAKEKLSNKKLDMIVLNSLKDQGAGFAVDTNKVTIIKNNDEVKEYPLKSKSLVAEDIVDNIEFLLMSCLKD
ncbi:MAG: bifunctional phosphopantothenoylcysteine decarboxylase/phosphopantothenate--cysteine ligase CoaBC [Bacteroidales bacterium]